VVNKTESKGLNCRVLIDRTKIRLTVGIEHVFPGTKEGETASRVVKWYSGLQRDRGVFPPQAIIAINQDTLYQRERARITLNLAYDNALALRNISVTRNNFVIDNGREVAVEAGSYSATCATGN
jgi:hypothetical protein